ncbi:MAG: cytidylate kinase family protein [Chloroflexota bacterium]|nr:cytidylate kinase family protein [Chloroflexota bacterium]
MPVLTIRGQLGSGAPEIGRLVAERIEADYVDREILASVAERVQRDPREILAKEMPPGTRLGRIAQAVLGAAERGHGYLSIVLPIWEMPSISERWSM